MSTQTDDYDRPENGAENGSGNADGKDDDHGCGESSGCADCDPDLFDKHKCRREGIQAQADFNATAGPELEQATADYETARKAYRDIRMQIGTEAKDLGEEIGLLIERIVCLIKDESVIDRLDAAYKCVVRTLKGCARDGACCSDDPCDYDATCPEDDDHHVDYNELVRKINEYERRLAEEKDCFGTLKSEPNLLKARFDAVKAEIDAVKSTEGGPKEGVDLHKLYVDALVARGHLRQIWGQFDSVQDFVDCLCRALTCWTKASEALSGLTYCLAVEDCKRRTHDEYCTRLRKETAAQVLLEYERHCSCHGEDEDEGENDEHEDEDDDTGEEDPECGCGHGHKHRRSHHDHRHSHDDDLT